MVLYKDIFTGDILVTDDYSLKLKDDILYEVEGKMTEDGIDLAVENKLVGAAIKKKTYQAFMKDYVSRIVSYLKKEEPSAVDTFKNKAKHVIKEVVENFEEYDFYTGESTNAEGMLVMCIFMTEDSPPTLKFWKHGMVQEEL